jgi:hypothetical protein
MKQTVKQSITGRKISKADALKDLGDPAVWQTEHDALMHEYHRRPDIPAKTSPTVRSLPGRSGIFNDINSRKAAGRKAEPRSKKKK